MSIFLGSLVMYSDKIFFSSDIDTEVQDECFQILHEALIDEEYDRVYVKNVVLAGKQVLFFVEIQNRGSIIRVPLKTY